MAKSHLPFHQKYRPKNLDDLVGQEVISLTLKQALFSKKIAPAYLFSGPRGTGKTSSARIFAKSLNCLSHKEPNPVPCDKCELCENITNGNALDIIEIDAASNTGVENIREIIERARFAPTQARWKVYVIDECHMLSTAASNALLKTIEEPPARVIFILATTNPERVLTTIQSRCQKFDFKRINADKIYKHLINIADKECIKFEENAIKLIAKRSNGGMRDAQSFLDQLSLLPDGITKKNVAQLLGEVPEHELISLIYSLINNNPESLLKSCSILYDGGNEPIAILEGLLNISRDLLLISINNEYSDLFYTSKDFESELNKISKLVDKNRIINWHSNLKNLEYQIKNSNQPRLWLEINLTSLLSLNNKDINHEYKNQQHIKFIKDKKIEKKIDLNNVIPEEKVELKVEGKKLLEVQSPVHAKQINQEEDNNFNDDESINLKEKWSLILSKLELPSTRMLLSQQAELLSIDSHSIEIGISPNWENMIKSRKIIIENAVKKIFGERIKIQFTSGKNIKKEKAIFKEGKEEEKEINEKLQKNISKEQKNTNQDKSIQQNSSKNLADFFNGEVIDIKE